MAKCVEIMVDDDGAITVKECEPKIESEEDDLDDDGYESMPAKNIDEAFSMASEILMQTDEMTQEQQGFDSVFQKQEMKV